MKEDDKFGFLLILGGVCIWIYQIYNWLKDAEWKSVSLLSPLSYYSPFYNWVYYPSDWIGFHNLLGYIPLSVTLIITGALLANLYDY